ncbi:MAG TPA: type II secretion system minor pseudopilin GspJ [Gammaproteobacteria bacterium]|nr:type II secretion system minor pseudopilin GspJ [Gammaproteobacteria bacterium]
MSRRHSSRGFTLLELLVAVAILAIIGVIALVGLNRIIDQQALARERAERWQEIQLAIRLITQDLAQLHPRATREELGETYQPSLLADPSAQFALEFSRGGWANPAGLPRGTVLRVAYNWEDDKLVRWHWAVMDRTLSTPPVRAEILDGVTNVEVRFLDRSGEWHLEWPPLDRRGPQSLISEPRAVEFAIELTDLGRVFRLVETSG